MSARTSNNLPPPEEAPPPHADDTDERLVLGALLTYPEATINLLGASVDPALFVSPTCALILNAATGLIAEGAPLNVMTLTQKLRDLGQLENVGGAYEVTRFGTDFACTPAVAEYHLSRLRDTAALRIGLRTAEWLTEVAQNGGTDPAEIVAGMIERMDHIRAIQDAGQVTAVSLGALLARPVNTDAELLRTRYLCRGGGLLLVGPTGVGKSGFEMQAAISWALGRPCFGIAPARPLRSVIIQAENDDDDLAEMACGVFAGMELSQQDKERASEMVHARQENSKSGAEYFAKTVEPLLRLYRPDLLWIDPALSYIDGDASSQEDVGRFLRNWLNPLLSKYQCGAVVVHHTNKPASGKDKPDWSGSELAYMGSGSAEWANWARAILGIRSLGANGIFELCLGKRGSRAGWRNEADEPIYSTLIGHAKEAGRIHWRNVERADLDNAMTSTGGAPKRFTGAKLLDILGDSELTLKEWQKLASDEHGMSRSTFFTLKAELEAGKKIHRSKLDGKWQRRTL